MRTSSRLLASGGFLLILAAGIGIGYWAAVHPRSPISTEAKSMPPVVATKPSPKVLYWYDPMVPTQRFDRPGKSPFMDMQLVPKYADDHATNDGGGDDLKIDPRVSQNLGVRMATVRTGELQRERITSGQLAFNTRDLAVVQTRTAAYVERVYDRAPGDVLATGAALVDLFVPEWMAAQQELIAVKAVNDGALNGAARSRLERLGMSRTLIDAVIASGKPQATITIRAPLAGVLTSLEVRNGMSLAAGATLATINGLDPLWLEVAVPESALDRLAVGQTARAQLAAFPGDTLTGTIAAILPDLDSATRTARVRIELPNSERRLKAGMSARVILPAIGTEALLVPMEAVIRTGTRTFVMREQNPGQFRAVAVDLGHEGTTDVEVRRGLQAGDRVVASGQFLFDSEASLRGRIEPESAP